MTRLSNVATLNLAELPRPEKDPGVLRVVEAIAALEIEATALATEVKSTGGARADLEERAVRALAVGDAGAAGEAEANAVRLGAILLEARGRLRAIGAHLGALASDRHAALAAACRDCAAAWKDAEQVLGLSLSEVEARATDIKNALAEVVSVRRQLDQMNGPGEAVAVKFVLSAAPYNAGEIGTFPASEAAHLVTRGMATYMDSWRRLAAGGIE